MFSHVGLRAPAGTANDDWALPVESAHEAGLEPGKEVVAEAGESQALLECGGDRVKIAHQRKNAANGVEMKMVERTRGRSDQIGVAIAAVARARYGREHPKRRPLLWAAVRQSSGPREVGLRLVEPSKAKWNAGVAEARRSGTAAEQPQLIISRNGRRSSISSNIITSSSTQPSPLFLTMAAKNDSMITSQFYGNLVIANLLEMWGIGKFSIISRELEFWNSHQTEDEVTREPKAKGQLTSKGSQLPTVDRLAPGPFLSIRDHLEIASEKPKKKRKPCALPKHLAGFLLIVSPSDPAPHLGNWRNQIPRLKAMRNVGANDVQLK
ncbi:hypothetical protein BDK51DRAFT_39854 [Blyttiomyces helicus]|uniref:Uncharacterized protein n=1 Tax=Blyttiomyces helicus TaxID=388810 RepID=A0A4P9VYZ8_9FUNG|nr:hypothetical protein BDK51DRAFT_39854 [Blyttiomyces helicus]|eukprot:RKO84984.1 hypothetical protein BDK51DRAFT_39854 [Blyttiomyces helicus]